MWVKSKLGREVTKDLSKRLKSYLCDIIEHCTDVIQSKKTMYTISDFKEYEPYEVINRSDHNAQQIFMFPPVGGGIEVYYDTVASNFLFQNTVLFNNFHKYLIDSERNQFALQHTYQSLASKYIQYMKRIQPKGPYNIFGWSFGGVLGFE
jgi:hypothetical protein